MFNRSRMQLTIRNAAVLSIILISLNVFIFIVMKQMLFAQVDRSLTDMRERSAQVTLDQPSSLSIRTEAAAAVPIQRAVLFSVGAMDRPIIQLFWTEDEQLVPMLGRDQFTSAQLKQLLPSKIGRSVKSVKVGDQHFRVLNIDQPTIASIYSTDNSGGQTYTIATQQLLSNISAEIGMLRRLEQILLYGGLLGLMIAVAAGYYLANRALIPIRRSMDKQQQFVSDASHELRTPLSVIQAHTELLLRHPGHTIEQDSKHVSTILQETRRMSKLVGGLLLLARTDTDKLELDLKSVQFDRIVQDCVEKMQMLAEVKDIILQSEIEGSVPMNADEERLHQMLIVILDNAIKYTSEGGLVRVVCRKLAHSVQLEVEDTGVGIAPDDLPRVFDRFYRGDKARNRQEGGSGLGLAIAKWIVERHGGKIRLESKLSSGTQVFVTLPI